MQDQSQSQQDNPHEWKWPHQGIEPPDLLERDADDAAQRDAQRQLRIRDEAYRIAEQEGFPENAAMDHWLEAERRITRPEGSDSERF